MKLVAPAYLASYTLSLLGNSIAAIALPLIVLQVTGSALGAGTVAAASALPAVLAGLLMGVVIDRINRRTASVITDLVSAASIAALPLVDLVGDLSLGWFVALGIVGSIGDVPGMTAREALLPAVVRHSGVPAERLTGLRESIGAVALLVGPAAAGTLMVVFDGSTVLWITAATSLLAALVTLLLPRAVGRIAVPQGSIPLGSGRPWTLLREGWATLATSRFLITTTALSVVSVVVIASLQGLLLPVWFTEVGRPGLLGFVLTALAAGTLVGGLVYATLGPRGRRRSWFVAGLVGSTIGLGLIATLASVWMVFLGAFVLGLSSGLFGSLVGVLMIERIPEHLRGRVMGTQNAIVVAAPSAGILVAAVLTEYAGVGPATIAVTAIWLTALALGLFARSLRTLEPEPVDPGVRDEAVSTGAQR